MKKEKAVLGVRKARVGDPKDLGIITLGKSRLDKTKYVLIDVEYDEKAERELYEIGLKLLAKDKEAVINYVIVKAIKNTAKLKCKK